MLKRKAQSTLEYVIILSAIVLAILAARPIIRNAVNRGMTDATNSMQDATGRLPGAGVSGGAP